MIVKAIGVLSLAACVAWTAVAHAQSGTGTIKGHVRLTGKLPGNPVIRMGMDPMCAQVNAGKRIVQEVVVADINGNLANVFVTVKGTFPQTASPVQPVVIDQRGCIYTPRVVGVRVGQTLQIKNSDPLLHTVHSDASHNPNFNTSQPTAGLVYQYKPQAEEIMIRLRCDVHRWMTAYVAVTSNPYFTVSGTDGTFSIERVPSGTYTVQAWHERYGPVSKSVTVKAGAPTTVDFTYASDGASN